MLFCPKYCPYLLSFSFGFLFYFHDVECMCIKRRDTYDQWIVAETCSILFLFVKICNSVFWSRFNWKPWFLFTLCIYILCCTELDSPSEIIFQYRPEITVIKRKQSMCEKSLKRKEFGEGYVRTHTFRSIFDVKESMLLCLLVSLGSEVSSLFETRSVKFTKLSWKLIVFLLLWMCRLLSWCWGNACSEM